MAFRLAQMVEDTWLLETGLLEMLYFLLKVMYLEYAGTGLIGIPWANNPRPWWVRSRYDTQRSTFLQSSQKCKFSADINICEFALGRSI